MPASRIFIRSACGGWKVFENPVKVLSAYSPDSVAGILKEIEKACSSGLHSAGFLSYEASAGLDKHLAVHPLTDFPYAWFGLYRSCRLVESLPEPDGICGQISWKPSVLREEYCKAVARIKSYIQAGDTYQVNYTIKLRSAFCGDPLALFKDMYRAQPSQYSAYLETDGFAVLSASPELFFERRGRKIVSKPMKGTASRGLYAEADNAAASELSHSEKNRAENIMIVDMIRNDLGRLADKGSVNVDRTFDVERLPTVLQMTSTVSALSDAGVADVMAAMFPCASITGAPKVRTMQIIKELESGPRGIYTGAIGHVEPSGDMQFNVAIRTVSVNRQSGAAEYGVGGGIVWDSVDSSEYDECIAKAGILAPRRADFCLLETLLWRRGSGFFLLDGHIARLRSSAEYFGFVFDPEAYRNRLDAESASFGADTRVRTMLDCGGRITVETAPVPAARVLDVSLADNPVSSADVFLYHKTTMRDVYERAKKNGFDDVLLYNEKGELTESSIANIVLETGGRKLTPRREAGLLNGVFRAHLLGLGEITEAALSIDDLFRADKVHLVNSLRGWIQVRVAKAGRLV